MRLMTKEEKILKALNKINDLEKSKKLPVSFGTLTAFLRFNGSKPLVSELIDLILPYIKFSDKRILGLNDDGLLKLDSNKTEIKTEFDVIEKFAFNKDVFETQTDWLIPNDILANELTIVYAKKTMKNHFLNFLFSFVVKDRQDKLFFFVDLENSVRTIIENGFADFTKYNANFKHFSKGKMWGKENEVFDSFLGFNKEFLSNSVFVINKLDVYADKQKQIDRLDKLRYLGATIILVVDHKELDLNSLDYVPDVEVLEASKFF